MCKQDVSHGIEVQHNLCWYEASSLKKNQLTVRKITQIFISPRYKINLMNDLPAFKNVGHPVGLSVTHDCRVKS
jgi:hypothetical protein